MEGFSEKNKQKILSDISKEQLNEHEVKTEQQIIPAPQVSELEKKESKPDLLKDAIIEHQVPDEALQGINREAPAENSSFELLGSKEEIMAQMETEMSLGTSLLIGKVTEKSKKAARAQFREKYNNKVYERSDLLAGEIKAFVEKNKLITERNKVLQDKIKALRDEKKANKELSKAKADELKKLELEVADMDKLKNKNSSIIKRRKETVGILKQDLKIRYIVATYREKLEKEKVKGNSALMNNMIQKVEAFDNLVNSPNFDIAKQYSYIKEFIEMRNAIALYHDKNKGFKWFELGDYRRDLSFNFLKNLDMWIAGMPEEIQDTFLQEMEKPQYEQIRSLKTSDELYQELGEKAFKAKAAEEGNPELKVSKYVTPLTIRMMSAHRSSLRESKYAEEYDLTKVEKDLILAGEGNKDPNITYQDPRCWIYTFMGLKRNYDGSSATPEMENIIREGVSAWRHNDLEKMKPFLDKLVERIMSYDVKLEDFLPSNLKKNGPTLLLQQDLMMSIQNVFFTKGTIGEAYLKEKGAALKAKLEMISSLNPFVRVFHLVCTNMNISTSPTTLGEIVGIEKWLKQNNGKKTEAAIKKLVENLENAQNMEIVSLDQNNIQTDRIPEPDKPKAFRKKYRLNREAVDETKEITIPYEDMALSQLVEICTRMTQRGEYFDTNNSQFRMYDVAKELKALIAENSDYEEQILDVYHLIDAKEREVRDANNANRMEQLKEELVKLHKQKDDFVTYINAVHEKNSNKKKNFPELKNRFLANYFGYENRNPELANKYDAKRVDKIDKLPTGDLSTRPELQLNLIKKEEYEKKIAQGAISEERKAVYQNYLNAQNELAKIREEHAFLQEQINIESGSANSVIGNIFRDEEKEGVPVENRTAMSNCLIGKEYRDRVHKLLAKAIDKQKTIVDLEKQARGILWKQIYQLTEIRDKDGNSIAREKSVQILDIMNEYMSVKEYCNSLEVQRAKLQQCAGFFAGHMENLGLDKALKDFAQSINKQYEKMTELKNQMSSLCKDELPGLADADITEVEATLKNNIFFMTEQGLKTLTELEKDEFINEKMYALRAAGPSSMKISKEGAELAYRRTHRFAPTELDLLRRYVTPGSDEDQILNKRFSSGNIDRIVCAGLHFIRFDENHKILAEDIEKDEWNKKWIKACMSDNYENDIKPMLQNLMDELLKFADIPYTDRTSDTYHLQDDKHLQDFLRMSKLGLTFESNILKNPHFSKFKEDYLNGTPEERLKWKKLETFSGIGNPLNLIADMKIRAKYFLDQGFGEPSENPETAENEVRSYYAETKLPAYASEIYRHAENKMFTADIADVYTRMAEIPNFSIDHVAEYEEFFKFYAKLDDLDANIAEANKKLNEIKTALANVQTVEESVELTEQQKEYTKNLKEYEKDKKEHLKGKKAMLERVNPAKEFDGFEII